MCYTALLFVFVLANNDKNDTQFALPSYIYQQSMQELQKFWNIFYKKYNFLLIDVTNQKCYSPVPFQLKNLLVHFQALLFLELKYRNGM